MNSVYHTENRVRVDTRTRHLSLGSSGTYLPVKGPYLMASVSFVNATRVYPGATTPAVDKLNLKIEDGEFLVLVGTYLRYPAAAILAALALVLSAMYILWTYQRMFGGAVRGPNPIRDLSVRQRLVVAPLIAAVLLWAALNPAGRSVIMADDTLKS